MKLSDDLKKIFLAGVGAAAVSTEKAGEILNDLVKKGEITVEQGKELNQELRHTIRENQNKKDTPKTSSGSADADGVPERDVKDEVSDMLSGLSDDQLSQLKELLVSFKNKDEGSTEDPE